MKTKLLFALGLLLALMCAPLVAGDRIQKYRTDQVRLFTDIGKKRAHEMMARIEFFGEFIDKYFKEYGLSQKKQNPIRCRLFAKEYDFLEFQRKGSRLRQAGAYFSASNNCIVACYHNGEKKAMSLLLHEVTHQVLLRYFPDPNPWIDEGFACYFAGVEFDPYDEVVTMCNDQSRFKHMQSLARGEKLLDWKHFFEIKRNLFDEDSRYGRINVYDFYTQAWGVLYFYLHYPDDEPRALFTKLLKGLNTGRERSKLLLEDLPKRQKTFLDYFKSDLTEDYRLFKNATDLRKTGKFKEAMDSLFSILIKNETHKPALRLGAEISWENASYNESFTFWNSLSNLDPKKPVYVWMGSRCLNEEAKLNNQKDKALAAVKLGSKAVKLTKSQCPDSLAALAMAYHTKGDLKKALSTMRKATRLVGPNYQEYKALEKSYSQEVLDKF